MTKASDIVNKVLKELNGRSGYNSLWNNLDEDTKAEIHSSIKQIISEGKEYPLVTGQMLHDAGLNPFAVQLLAESYAYT